MGFGNGQPGGGGAKELTKVGGQDMLISWMARVSEGHRREGAILNSIVPNTTPLCGVSGDGEQAYNQSFFDIRGSALHSGRERTRKEGPRSWATPLRVAGRHTQLAGVRFHGVLSSI